LEKPKLADNYDFYSVDEIGVYIRKDTNIKEAGIHVFLRKILWIKELSVDGISINY